MKKFLFVVFVMLALLPLVAQAQPITPPLSSWNQLFSSAGEQMTATAFGKTATNADGIIVQVGYSGTLTATGITAPGESSVIRTSSDGGFTWTVQYRGPDNSRLNAATFGNGRFVVVGQGGTNETGLDLILTSNDGIYWQKIFPIRDASYESGLALNGVAFGGPRAEQQFVAVGTDSSGGNIGALVYTSPDGITWTRRVTISDAVNLRAVIGRGLNPYFVTVGDDTHGNGRIFTTENAINWTERARENLATYPLATIANGDSIFVAGGDRFSANNQTYFTSSNGYTWYPQTNLSSYGMYGIDGIKFGNIGNPADTAEVPGFVVASATLTQTPWAGAIFTGRRGGASGDDPGVIIFGPANPRFSAEGVDFDGIGYADGAFLGLGAFTPEPNAVGEFGVIFGSDYPIPDVPTLFICQPFLGTGNGTVKSSSGAGYPGPGGINCGDVGPGQDNVCSYRFLQYSDVVLTAEATSQNFIEWTGACTGTSPVCVVPMDRTQNVCATFGLSQYTVTPVAGPGGYIYMPGTNTPARPVAVGYKQTTAFDVVPATGYHIASVTGCGVTTPDYNENQRNRYTTAEIVADCTVNATFAINEYRVQVNWTGRGVVTPLSTSTSGGVQVINHGTAAVFTMTPGAAFGAPLPYDGSDYFIHRVSIRNNDQTPGAVVKPWPIGFNCSGELASQSRTVNTYTTGAIFPPSPSDQPWDMDNGTLVCIIDVDFDKTEIFHVFPVVLNEVLKPENPRGSITPGTEQLVLSGDSKEFIITPDAGYTPYFYKGAIDLGFIDPRLSGKVLCDGTYSNGVFRTRVVSDCVVAVVFARDNYVVTPVAGANGTITPNTPQFVQYGAQIDFTVTPARGYRIDAVTGCGVTPIAEGSTTYITAPIVENCTVNATFTNAPLTVAVTSVAGANGTISPSGTQQVALGSTAAFTVTPNAGYKILAVAGCGGTLVGNTYTTAPVTEACTVEAAFTTICTYVITPATKIFPAKWWGLTANIAVVASGAASCPAPVVTVVQGSDWLSASLQNWSQFSWSNNKGTVKATATANTTGAPRNGAVVIGDKVWTATQSY